MQKHPNIKKVILIIVVGLLFLNTLQFTKSIFFPSPYRDLDVFFSLEPPLNIAHRGASGNYPENTLKAFSRAIEKGADALELDIWLTEDFHPAVIHDRTVDRTTDGEGYVSSFTREEIRKLDAGYRFSTPDGEYPFRGKGIKIPMLDEVLEAFPDIPVMIEIKRPGVASAEIVARVIEEAEAENRVFVGTMNNHTIEHFRRIMPEIPTAASWREVRRFFFLSHFGLAGWMDWDFEGLFIPPQVDFFPLLTAPLLAGSRAGGYPIFLWTINEPERMQRFLEAGVHGIITDYPGLLVNIMREWLE